MTTAKDRLELNDRSLRVLAMLVREHIQTGEPVSSGVLARRAGLGLSSATIRSVIASLDAQGYLHQPHTSAGRVPTELGYRCFVDQILQSRRPIRSSAVEAQLRQQVGPVADLESVLSTVSHVLSNVSHYVAFALAPPDQDSAFHHVEFLQLSNGRVLVIVVARHGQVSHKVVDVDERLSSAELDEAARYLNSEFSGLSLTQVRTAIVQNLKEERGRYNRLMARALRLARSSFEGLGEPDSVFVEGASSLFEEAAEPNSGITISALTSLVKMIEDKHRLVRLLTAYMEAPGVTVIIGDEHAEPGLRPFSLVASTYSGGEGTGTVGVIGPMRMHYSRAITVVHGVADAVSRVLADARRDEAQPRGSSLPSQ